MSLAHLTIFISRSALFPFNERVIARYFILIYAACLLTAVAQSPVTLTVDTGSLGLIVPSDFIGLSFETGSLQYDSPGVKGYLFDPANTQLLTLFRNIGIKNLRIGGSSVDRNDADYLPATKDIDVLFRFARAGDLEVIYSLRLLNGDPSQDAMTAQYVQDHYKQNLACFAIGNEPNLYGNRDPDMTNVPSFFIKWKRFATAIVNAVPDAEIGGPDNGTGGASWASFLAKQETGSRNTAYVFAHYYVGGNPRHKTPGQLVAGMLSSQWDTTKYPAYYAAVGAVALSEGFPYRLTELNNFVANMPGVWGGNNSFATSLFALDCMHWWAAHQCTGVNFHTVIGKYNGTIYCDTNGNCQIWPIAYGIKAFDVGGHGRIDPVTIGNPDNLNLTAYAVTATNNDLFVTIINKENGAAARAASVTITPKGFDRDTAKAIFLTAPGGNLQATSGITLGGAPILNNAPWDGRWTPLSPASNAGCVVVVPAASAAIVKLSEH